MSDVVSTNKLNVQFGVTVSEISAKKGDGKAAYRVITGTLSSGSATTVHARYVILASGLSMKSESPEDADFRMSRFPNATHYTYADAPWDCSAYRGKHVLVFGNGNAGTEFATHIISECAATRTWIVGKTVLNPSHHSHYVGGVRTHNLLVQESYQLKSLDISIEENASPKSNMMGNDPMSAEQQKKKKDMLTMQSGMMGGDGMTVSPDVAESVLNGDSANVVVIRATGFLTNMSIKIPLDRPRDDGSTMTYDKNHLFRNRYISLGAFNEVKGAEGIYGVGSISHGRDHKESSGGFIHGFRYTVGLIAKNLDRMINGKSWPYKVLTSEADLFAHTKMRVQSSSALWHLQTFMADLVVSPPGSGVWLYVEQIPTNYELDIVSNWVVDDYKMKEEKKCAMEKTCKAKGSEKWTADGAFVSTLSVFLSQKILSEGEAPYHQVDEMIMHFIKKGNVKINGKEVDKSMAKRNVPLNAGDVVEVKGSTKTKKYTVDALPKFGTGRMVLMFSYGPDFKGCNAVYSKDRAFSGFISPTLYLETDARLTLPSGLTRGGVGSENIKSWNGWDVFVESEDLFGRWVNPLGVEGIVKKYAAVCAEDAGMIGASYKGYDDADMPRETWANFMMEYKDIKAKSDMSSREQLHGRNFGER